VVVVKKNVAKNRPLDSGAFFGGRPNETNLLKRLWVEKSDRWNIGTGVNCPDAIVASKTKLHVKVEKHVGAKAARHPAHSASMKTSQVGPAHDTWGIVVTPVDILESQVVDD
jgi:hypothetical protein